MNRTWGTTPSPEDRRDPRAPRAPRTYYQRAGISVTDRYVTVSGRRFDVADMVDVWTVRGPRDPVGVGAALVAMVVFAIALGWSHYGPPLVSLAIAAVSFVPAGLALVAWKTRRRHYELWADYRGADVQVLMVLDGEVYGQICRAVIRAREASGEQAPQPRDWYGVPRPSPVF